MEYRKEKFNEKISTNNITKEQWFYILKNNNLIGLRDMKALLSLYNREPLMTSLKGECLEDENLYFEILNICKKIDGLEIKEEDDLKSSSRYLSIMLEESKVFDRKKKEGHLKWTLKKELRESISLLFDK